MLQRVQHDSTGLEPCGHERHGLRRGGYSLVEKAAEGLPDGGKRFILYVLSAYLANVIEHALSRLLVWLRELHHMKIT